ncbi:hypothetical protein Tco_0501897 [Tanacetum coccineum]
MLKRPLKKLSWKQGNVFDNVVVLKDKLKSIQADVDKNPHNAELKKEAVFILNVFVKASKVEMKFLQQKAKMKWLKEGDKNTAFFHSIIKTRKSKNRVEYIKDDAGVSYEGEDNAGDSAKGKARVAWKMVCRPKEQGGLGIKSLKRWIEVLLIRQFWKIIEDRNSLKISVWYDKWCTNGPLSTVISRRDMYDARLDDDAKVADLIKNGQWEWLDG